MFDREPYTYRGDHLRELAFPLGGIGTGCVSLDGRGGLRDWEIYGRPNKGKLLKYTFAALWLESHGKCHALNVLGPKTKEFIGDGLGYEEYAQGYYFKQCDGLPGFDDLEFVGTYPTAQVRFKKHGLPVEIELVAFNPMIPLDSRSSSFPSALLTYKIRNVSMEPVRGVLAWNMTNPVGEMAAIDTANPDKAFAKFREGKACRGIEFFNDRFTGDDIHSGTFALTTDWNDVLYSERWLEGEWFDTLQDFWNGFSKDASLPQGHAADSGKRHPASLGLRFNLEPGEEAELPFLFSWVFPNSTRYWEPAKEKVVWKPYHAAQWPTAWDAAEEFLSRKRELTDRTNAYVGALFNSTLPNEVIESISATSSTLKTTTCLRLEDGTFWAWEGCGPTSGCCSGTCSHVWNYALTHAYLFPDLQRSIKLADYDNNFNCGPMGERGALVFRTMLPIGESSQLWHAASDGQLGGIVQVYRDWRMTGDEETLRYLWPKAKKALEFAWIQWDRDRDGLVEGDMHNTYDINFQGPNPLSQFFYMAALRAGEEISRHLGDADSAEIYRSLYQKGKTRIEDKDNPALWNGEFFEQNYDCLAADAPKYQHGKGCLSDQVFGLWCASAAGLGDLIDPTMVQTALKSIYDYNFKSPLGDHANLQRVYAVADEAGLLLCSWPNGGRPEYPFVYSDEVWTGIEYQVAAHLAHVDLVSESLNIVKAIRARYDGTRRNPYNEFECGAHYARALASYGLLLALSGFSHDAVTGETVCNPKHHVNEFECFFSTGTAWGVVSLGAGGLKLNVIEGELKA